MPWDATLISHYRREFISPHCELCEESCCVFGMREDSVYSFPLSPDEMLAVCAAGMAAAWPLQHDGAQVLLRSGVDEIVDGPCPAYRDRRCLIYGSPARPGPCATWPIWDNSEVGHPEQWIIGCTACPVLRNGGKSHVKAWLEDRAGVKLAYREKEGSSKWFWLVEEQ